MAINDISLTSGMRSNLLSLQDTVSLLNRTQERLSTGKKVNTAIDNPVSFFAAQSLNSRASKIDSLKDAMGQGIQTITAADKGIKAITSMIEQAKGIAQQALSADNGKSTLSTVGLEAGDIVTFNGKEYTASGLTEAAIATDLASQIATDLGTDGTAAVNGTTTTQVDIELNDSELSSLKTQYDSLLTQIDSLAGDSGYKGVNLLADNDLTVKFEGADLQVAGFKADTSADGLNIGASTTWGDTDADEIQTSLAELDKAVNTLSSKASELSSNLSIITVRQDFSTNMINTLSEGSDKLTAADTNEEGANMLMLQTRQSLATTALSLSAQAAQSVLKLFG